MKLFKTIDEKIMDLGFIKEKEDKFGVRYIRKNDKYTQIVDILHKASERHILQSYDKDLGDNQNIGNTCVGLTYTEMKLFVKKMAKIGYKS